MIPWYSTVCVQHKMFSRSAPGGGHLLYFKAFIYFFTMKDAAKKKKILKHKPLNTGAFVSPE